MRLISLIFMSMLLIGCATLGSAKKTSQLNYGMSMAEVSDLLGQPRDTQLIGNKIVWKYSLHQYFVGWVPYYLEFDLNNEKLNAWYANQDEYYKNQELWLRAAGKIEQNRAAQRKRQDEEYDRKIKSANEIFDSYNPNLKIPTRTNCYTDTHGNTSCTTY